MDCSFEDTALDMCGLQEIYLQDNLLLYGRVTIAQDFRLVDTWFSFVFVGLMF